MPIYAYRCGACGHAKDVLQKISDPVLTTCPACGAEAFSKQLTAAGFQLKGSGWYVTDFRGGASGGTAPATGGDGKSDTKTDGKTDSKADTKAETKTESKSDSGSSTSSGDSKPAASGGCGSGCACH
jgi:putative FmdB family regulatory protein